MDIEIYRILSINIYSPTTKCLADVIFYPFLIIIYYFIHNDFNTENNIIKISYFIINLIIFVFIVLSAGIYNELFVLYCCDFEKNTYFEISRRASSSLEYNKIESSFNDDNEEGSDD